jgi:flagellar basal-body rod protein FlgB
MPLKIAGHRADKTDEPKYTFRSRSFAMRMMDQLFGSHPGNLERALDRASLRHELLSKNLANVNTPGYKRQDIDFAITLDEEMNKQAEPTTYTGSVRSDGSSVDLESEVVAMAETELRYQLLTEMTSRYFSGLQNVIREGR